MKPTAQIIGLFGVIQMAVIMTGWFATRAVRKSFLVASEAREWTQAERGLADFFASYGLWCLCVPPLWCLFTLSTGNDTERASDAAAAAKKGLIFTVILFVGCLLAFMDMVLSFSTVLKTK